MMQKKKDIDQSIKAFQEEFRETANTCQNFCYMSRAKEFQLEARHNLEMLAEKTHVLKSKAIEAEYENAANAMLSFEETIEALINELSMWIAFKDENPGSAWDYLVNAQMAVINAMQAHSMASHLEDYAEHLSALEDFLFPKQYFLSPGLIIKEAKCSICGEEYGECEHVVGRPYMGEICSRVIIHADLEEASIVDKPANKHARIVSFTDEEGVHRDFLTWHVIPKVPTTSKESEEVDNVIPSSD